MPLRGGSLTEHLEKYRINVVIPISGKKRQGSLEEPEVSENFFVPGRKPHLRHDSTPFAQPAPVRGSIAHAMPRSDIY
jgi:hypothetical protein